MAMVGYKYDNLKRNNGTKADAVYENFEQQELIRRLQVRDKKKPRKIARHDLFKFIKTNRLFSIFPLFIAAVLAFVFKEALLSLTVALVLLVIASFSTSYKRKLGMPLGGIELVTFGTVLTSIAYGPWIGLVFGLISSVAAEILSANLGPFTWLYVVTLGSIGFVAGNFATVNLTLLGTIVTALTILINNIIYLFVGDEEIRGFTLLFIATNLMFNFLVFSTLGTRILSLMM